MGNSVVVNPTSKAARNPSFGLHDCDFSWLVRAFYSPYPWLWSHAKLESNISPINQHTAMPQGYGLGDMKLFHRKLSGLYARETKSRNRDDYVRVCSGHVPDRSRGSQIVTGSKILTVVRTMVPYIGFLAFKMSQIEAKSINFWLRYDPNWNISSIWCIFTLLTYNSMIQMCSHSWGSESLQP